MDSSQYVVFLCIFVQIFVFPSKGENGSVGANPRDDETRAALRENAILDSGFPKVVRVGETVFVSRVQSDEERAQWFPVSGSQELLLAVTSNTIVLKNITDDSTVSSLHCGHVTASVNVQGTSKTALAISLEDDEKFELVFVEAANSNLLVSVFGRFPMNYRCTHLAVWKNIVASARKDQLEVYETSGGRLQLLQASQLPGHIADLAISRYLHGCLAAVTVPAADQVFGFHFSTSVPAVQDIPSLSLMNPTSVSLFQVGSGTMLAVGGPEAGIWRFRPDSTLVPVSAFHGPVDVWLSVPVAGFRQLALLLGQQNDRIIVLESDGFYNFKRRGDLSVLCTRGEGWCREVVTDLSRASAAADTIILPSVDSSMLHLALEYQVKVKPSTVQQVVSEMDHLERDISVVFEEQNEKARNLMEEEKKGVATNNTHLVQGEWTVDLMDITQGEFAPTSNDHEFQVEEWSFAGREDWSEQDVQVDIEDLIEIVEKLQDEIVGAKEMLQDILEGNLADVETELPTSILGGLTVTGSVKVNNLHVDSINGQLSGDWANDCYRLDYPQPIKGVKTAPSVDASQLHFSSIDGVPISQLVHMDSDVTITGDVSLDGGVTVAGDVILPPDGTVNGYTLNEDLMLPNSVYKGWSALESVVVRDSARLGVVSAGDGTPDTIIPVRFSPFGTQASVQHTHIDNVLVREDLSVEYVNGEDIGQLLSDLSKDEGSIENLSIKQLNGVPFPDSFVLKSSASPIVITGEKKFSDLRSKRLSTDFRSFLELLAYESIKPEAGRDEERNGGFLKSGLGVDEGFYEQEDETTEDFVFGQIPTDFVFENLEVDTIQATTVDDVTWDERSVIEKASPKKRCRTKELAKSAGDLDENEIMEEELDTAFLHARSIEVHGSVDTDGTVSGLNLQKYSNYLSRSKAQEISAKLLKGTLTVSNLTTAGPLTGHRLRHLRDILAITDIQKLHVNGVLDAEFIAFDARVRVDEINVTGTVDGVDFTSAYKDAIMQNTTNVFISGEKSFQNGVTAEFFNTYKMNGNKPSWIVTRSGNHSIRAPVEFNGDVRFAQNLHIAGFVNGANLTDLAGRVSSKFGAFLVLGDQEILPGAVVENIVAEGLIQNTNMTKLLDNLVKTNADLDLSALNITFNNSVSFEENIDIRSSLNDMNLTAFFADLVLANRSASLQQLVLEGSPIMDHLAVSGSLTTPLLDGCDVSKWLEEAIYLNQDTKESTLLKFANAVVEGEMAVHLLNGRSLDSMIPLSSNQMIPATLRCRRLRAGSHIAVAHSVNGHVLADVWKDSLRHNDNQVVTGHKKFTSDVQVSGDIAVPSIGERPIEDLVTLYTDQNMTGVTVEGEVTARADLLTAGYVAGVPVVEWKQRALTDGTTKKIKGSWIVKGNTTTMAGILGSGRVLGESLINISQAVDEKLQQTTEINREIRQDFEKQCLAVSNSTAYTENQLRMVEMFEDVQGLQFHLPMQSAVHYRVNGTDYVLATFVGRCSARLYAWVQKENKLVKIARVFVGPIDVWTTLPAPQGLYLVVSGPRSCHRNKPSSGLWHISGTNFTELNRMEEFSDVISDSASLDTFHSVSANGSVVTWTIRDGLLVVKARTSVAAGKYKFVSAALGLGLSLWDGDRIVAVDSAKSSKLAAASTASGPEGLIALSDGLSRVFLYRHGEFIQYLHHSNPTDLHWIDLKAPGELYLMFASDHHRIYIYQFKGAAGLVRRSVLAYPSSRLIVLDLPLQNSVTLPHVLVVYDRVLHLLQVKMHGRPSIKLHLNC